MHPESNQQIGGKNPGARWALPALAVVLAATSIFSWVSLSGERRRSAELATANQNLTDSMIRMQRQIETVSQQLGTLSQTVQSVQSAQATERSMPEAAAPPSGAVQPKPRPAARRAPSRPVPDPRIDQLQNRLSEQEKAIASTREQVDRNRQDLEGQLGDARTELTGSIARTHEELVELQKRGERNYYEFEMLKSKEFRRIGPLGLSLRKVNTKRKSFDIALRVDDQEMQKKSVNLFEPIQISAPSSPQPLQLVVMEVTKDRVKGYVSEPKHTQPKLAAGSQPSAQPPALQQR